MEFAVEIAARPLVESESAAHPVETPMDSREFDYDVFIKPMESRMMRSIWRIVRQKEAAEDALQDALAVIWKKRDVVARHPHPEALILKISVDAAYDAVRKMRRRLRHEVAGLPAQPFERRTFSVTEEAEFRALRAAVLEAIGRLPKKQATAVLLRIVEEESYEDIARGMRCSATTVRIHVMRGRAVLASRLGRLWPKLAGRSEGKDRGGKV